MARRRLHPLALAVTLLVPCSSAPPSRAPLSGGPRRGPLPRAALAAHRAVPRRAHEGRHRRARQARPLLHRRRQRRRLEDDRLRPDVAADLRRPADGVDRRDRRRALESRRDLRRQRRGHAAARPLDRRRDLQVDGRGPDLAAPRPARRPADPADRRGPEGREEALRRRARPPVRAERGARGLPLDRRGRDVPEGPLPRRGHGRRRRGPRPRRPRRRVRGPVGVAAGAVGERRVQRRGKRPLQVHRRRPQLAAAEERPAHLRRGPRADRDHGRAERPAAALRHRRGAGQGRHLSLRRRRRDVVAGELGPARRRPPRRRRRGARPPDEPRRRLRPDDRHVEVHGRREDVHGLPRRAGRRRLPAHLDRPRPPGRDDPVVGPGRRRHGQRRGDVEQLVQPADRAVLPREHRRRLPVPRVRRAAGERLGLRPEPRRRRPDHVPRLAPGGRRGVRLRRARPARSRRRLRRQGEPLRPAHGAGAERVAAPAARPGLPRDPHAAGSLLADRPEGPLLRVQHAVEDDGRRAALGGDQPRPDAEGVAGAAERGEVPGDPGRRRVAARRRSTPSPRRRSTRASSGPAPTTASST